MSSECVCDDTPIPTGGGFTSKRGVFGKAGRANTTMLCVAFGVTPGCCFTGGADGQFYHWEGSSLARAVPGHKGPVFALQRVEKVSGCGGQQSRLDIGAMYVHTRLWRNAIKTFPNALACTTTFTIHVHLYGTNSAVFFLFTGKWYDAETSAILLLLKWAFT